MNNKAYLLPLFLIAFTSCFEVKKLEIPSDLKEQLDMSKPTIIDPSEINGVACEIGDSIFKTLEISKDTSFLLGLNSVRIFGNHGVVDPILKSKFDAYNYSFDSDSNFVPKGVVKYTVKDTAAYYENAIKLTNNEIKMVNIAVDLSEVNLKVVHNRKELKRKNK